jgi:diguanylate cyclase (GGDEF)-like protein
VGEKLLNTKQKDIAYSMALLSYSIFALYFFTNIDFTKYERTDYLGMFFYLLLLLLVVIFPMKMNGTKIILIQPITLAIFLQFGFLVEIVITQVTILFFLIFDRARDLERYILNHTMFLFSSVAAACLFFLLGGELTAYPNQNTQINFIPISGYILGSIAMNHILLYVIHTTLFNTPRAFLSRELWWEILPILLIGPFGILVYFLYRELYVPGILYVAAPVVIFSLILQLYSRLNSVQEKLRMMNEIGTKIGKQLHAERVIQECISAIGELVPFDYCVCYLNKDHHLHFLHGVGYSESEGEIINQSSIRVGVGIIGQAALCGKTSMVGYHDDVRSSFPAEMGKVGELFSEHQSLLIVPLILKRKVIGLLVLSDSEGNTYSKEDATVIEMVANHTAIALKNAELYQEAKRNSEIDELTGVHNYRYFENHLFKQLDLAKRENKPLSLVLLDIDYFKQVNDDYGHLAGNRILKSIAELLLEELGDTGLVARYGGEEFTMLLYDTDKQPAFNRAEMIRQRVEATPFEIERDLDGDMGQCEKVKLNITVSVGLATYPVHSGDALNLIRHADRAMYVGAKRKGRNRVAVYDVG